MLSPGDRFTINTDAGAHAFYVRAFKGPQPQGDRIDIVSHSDVLLIIAQPDGMPKHGWNDVYILTPKGTLGWMRLATYEMIPV
jgi:hypothetical protein